MSHQSVFAKVVRASCWAGDVLLTLLAVYLAIHYRNDLTVSIVLALGLCVVLGGLLPLTVYGLDYLFAKNDRLMGEARAPENLRDALIRLEQLTRRVEDAAEGATKSTLIARQVPDRIEEKLGMLEAAAERLQSESLENIVAGLDRLTQRLDDLSHPPEHPAVEEDGPVPFRDIREGVSVAGDLESKAGPEVVPDLDAEGGENDFVDALKDDWVEEPSEFEGDFVPEEADEVGSSLIDEPANDDPLEEEILAEQEAEPPPPRPAKKRIRPKTKSTRRARGKPAVSEPEPTLFSHEELSAESHGLAKDQGVLVVKAMVGISNRLFARGDAPLSWDKGVPLRPSGIGEWRLELEGVLKPVQCELRINDEISARGEPITIEPGTRQMITPRFPTP